MAAEPQVSAIVPARNEEANIAAAVESLAAQTLPVEIIVVNDGSTDRTGAVLGELAARLPQLRVVENRSLPEGWTGKNHAVHLGIQQARADWFLLTDADVRHRPDAVEKGRELARKTGAAMVSLLPRQELVAWWEKATIPFIYCRLADEYPYERVSDPADPAVAANGQWLLVSRLAYNAVGGHAAIKSEILEDVALARNLKRSGCRFHFASGADVASTRMFLSLPELWHGWSKNLFPLFDRRRSAVAGAVAGAALDALSALLLLVGVYGLAEGWPVARWSLLPLLAVPVFRHARYAQSLRRNGYPLVCGLYYLPGSLLFAALLVDSARRYLSHAPLVWKGREYNVSAPRAN